MRDPHPSGRGDRRRLGRLAAAAPRCRRRRRLHALRSVEDARRPRATRAVDDARRPRLALDNGQHILIGAYRETLALLRELGVDVAAAFERTPLHLVGAHGLRLKASSQPAPWHLLAMIVTAQADSGSTSARRSRRSCCARSRRRGDSTTTAPSTRCSRLEPAAAADAQGVGAALHRRAQHADGDRVGAGLPERAARQPRQPRRATPTCCCRASDLGSLLPDASRPVPRRRADAPSESAGDAHPEPDGRRRRGDARERDRDGHRRAAPLRCRGDRDAAGRGRATARADGASRRALPRVVDAVRRVPLPADRHRVPAVSRAAALADPHARARCRRRTSTTSGSGPSIVRSGSTPRAATPDRARRADSSRS